MSQNVVNSYRYVAPETQTCQGAAYTGEEIAIGVDYPSGSVTLAGMIPRAGNTLIGNVCNKFSLLNKHNCSAPHCANLTMGAKIFNDSAVLQATSTNTILVETTDTTYEFRQFEFASDFTITEGYYYVIYEVSGSFSNANRINIQMNATPSDNNSLVYYSDTWYTSYFGTYKPVSICFTG